jgi:hypothetical protein
LSCRLIAILLVDLQDNACQLGGIVQEVHYTRSRIPR